MAAPSGLHYIDGKDLWDTYGIIVQSGSNDFLKFPARKDSITHNWLDSNGIDVDLSLPFFDAKKIVLKCTMIAATEDEFWQNYAGFLGEWAKPGTRDWSVSEFQKTFQVYYTESTEFTRLNKIIGNAKIACQFSLNLVQVEPDIDEGDAFIVDEDGRFIVT
jgi:hypothetical protein